MCDCRWVRQDVKQWESQLLQGQKLSENAVIALTTRVKELFISEPNILDLSSPISIAGDIHGQLYDLLELFAVCGKPPDCSYLFLGDYVDRGAFSVETISLMCCLKLQYPSMIHMLRGNHESRSITCVYGFLAEVKKKYNDSVRVWKAFTDLFDFLPIGATVDNSLFCVHGGISPCIRSLDQLRVLDRFSALPHDGPIANLLWSDPQPSIEGFQPVGEENEPPVTCFQSARGTGYFFGGDVVEEFLEINRMDCIVRGHQLCRDGYTKLFEGAVVTVWSAPNYCYRFGNVASVMQVDGENEASFAVFTAAPASCRIPGEPFFASDWPRPSDVASVVAEATAVPLRSVEAMLAQEASEEELTGQTESFQKWKRSFQLKREAVVASQPPDTIVSAASGERKKTEAAVYFDFDDNGEEGVRLPEKLVVSVSPPKVSSGQSNEPEAAVSLQNPHTPPRKPPNRSPNHARQLLFRHRYGELFSRKELENSSPPGLPSPLLSSPRNRPDSGKGMSTLEGLDQLLAALHFSNISGLAVPPPSPPSDGETPSMPSPPEGRRSLRQKLFEETMLARSLSAVVEGTMSVDDAVKHVRTASEQFEREHQPVVPRVTADPGPETQRTAPRDARMDTNRVMSNLLSQVVHSPPRPPKPLLRSGQEFLSPLMDPSMGMTETKGTAAIPVHFEGEQPPASPAWLLNSFEERSSRKFLPKSPEQRRPRRRIRPPKRGHREKRRLFSADTSPMVDTPQLGLGDDRDPFGMLDLASLLPQIE